jgi:arginine decarboxylase-like protein
MKKIKDTGLIASLYSHGFEATKRVVENKVVFYLFEDSELLSGTITLYNVGQLQVNARTNNGWYKAIIKDIKQLLAEDEKNNTAKPIANKETAK